MRADAPSKVYSQAEESFNRVTHGLGAILSIPAAALLITTSSSHGNSLGTLCYFIYGLTLFILYLSSTLYHSQSNSQTKRILRTVDCSAIYLLIAGSYTPVTLLGLPGVWGWSIFTAIWSLAALGIILNWLNIKRIKVISNSLYLVMGWLIVIASRPMTKSLPHGLLSLILIGGLFYTIGVIFYAARRLRFNHGIWHLFVLAGSLCHYLGFLFYLS